MDNQTKKLIDEAGQLKELVNHHGWRIAKQRLLTKLTELDSIGAMPLEGSADQVLFDIKLRQATVNLMISWLRELEGEAATEYNVTKVRQEEIIINMQ